MTDLAQRKQFHLERLYVEWLARRTEELKISHPELTAFKREALAKRELAGLAGLQGNPRNMGGNLLRSITGVMGVSDSTLAKLCEVFGQDPEVCFRNPDKFELEVDGEAFDLIGWRVFTRAGAEVRGHGENVMVSGTADVFRLIRTTMPQDGSEPEPVRRVAHAITRALIRRSR